jgi:hypothetical protein
MQVLRGLWAKANNLNFSLQHKAISHRIYKLAFVDMNGIKMLVYSRNDQHYAHICATALFYIPVSTCSDSSLPSSGSFWIRLSYMKIQIGSVVYLKYIKDQN